MVSFKIMRLFNVEKITLCVVDDADTIVTSQLVKDQIMMALTKSRILIVQSAEKGLQLNFMAPYVQMKNDHPLNVEQFFADCKSNVEKLKFAILFCKELIRNGQQGIIFVEVSQTC